MNAPTPEQWFPGCAACSAGQSPVTPFWRYARLSSEARRRGCYIWVGACPHSHGLSPSLAIVEDPAEWERVGALWRAKAAELFGAVTAKMGPRARDDHRRLCYGGNDLPGATAPLTLSAAEPAAPEQPEPTKAK